MDNQRDFAAASETAENPISPPTTSDKLPPCKNRSNRSIVWDHFTIESEIDKKAKCNYCSKLLKYDSGTSSMRGHLDRCKENPYKESNKRMKSASSSSGVISSPSIHRFDQEACQRDLVKLFVVAELSFQFVEHEAFREFLYTLQPKFNPPSRTTLARNIMTLWETEKKNLKNFLSQHCQSVCLTTDTWTSSQNMSYMCLTAHFIDNDWKIQKRIINFCQVASHSGEVMAKTVELCLNDWGLNRILSVTVDNASSNDLRIHYLKKRLLLWKTLVLDGDHIHMRCCAYILNLVVKEGLKEIDDFILRIRAAVRYVRSSPMRLAKFLKCVQRASIDYNGLVCLDVETRWNSTYTMLETALKFQKAFIELEWEEKKFKEELLKGKGVPTFDDWDHAQLLLPFLKIFYDATLRISGTSYVTSSLYMLEVFNIGRKISEMGKSRNKNISTMAEMMKTKFDKYWGKPDNLNMLLLIALVLDPRYKIGFTFCSLKNSFGESEGLKVKENIEEVLKSLFEEYKGSDGGSQSDSQLQDMQLDSHPYDIYGYSIYKQETGSKSNASSELEQYLTEPEESRELDVLNWWKVNSIRFPILATIARELLAIPVSTVASESAFSTGGRVLDPHRSSLKPQMVQALICTQDWLKGSSFSFIPEEDLEDIKELEQDMFSQPDVACSASVVDLDE